MFYANILSSAYNFYGRFKNEAPYNASIIYIGMCQILHFFLLLDFLKKYLKIDTSLWLPNEYLYFGVLIFWLIGLHIYFNKIKVLKIVEGFNTKSVYEKRIWGFISIFSLIIPLILLTAV